MSAQSRLVRSGLLLALIGCASAPPPTPVNAPAPDSTSVSVEKGTVNKQQP